MPISRRRRTLRTSENLRSGGALSCRHTMASYTGTADRPERAKAIAAVVAVHAALAFIILSGLSVRMVRQAVERLTTVDVQIPPPPPPRPAPRPHEMKKPAGAPAKKAEPSPIVAPPPKIPTVSPLPAARVA